MHEESFFKKIEFLLMNTTKRLIVEVKAQLWIS